MAVLNLAWQGSPSISVVVTEVLRTAGDLVALLCGWSWRIDVVAVWTCLAYLGVVVR